MKKVLYVIIGLVVLYVLLCLFGPAKVKVERSISINAAVPVVQNALLDFKFFQEKWSPWTALDPAMKVTYTGESGKPGSGYAWESDKKEVGKGSMEFIALRNDSILQKLRFDGQGDADVYLITEAEGAGTKVTWGMAFEIGFFGRAPMLFMSMDKMVGPDYEKGLASLKNVMESMASEPKTYNGYEVKEINWEEKTYLGKRAKLGFDKLQAFFGDNYGKIFSELGKNKIEPLAAPSAIYWFWDEEKKETDCAAVACVPNGTKVKGWETFTIPAANVLQIAYYGAYEKSMNAHMAMDEYMKEKSKEQVYVIEEYVTDPMNEKDTSKWLTNIYYVLK